MAKLERLLELADEILGARTANPLEKIQAISSYCEAFAAWRGEHKALEQSSLPKSKIAQLAALAKKNAAILALAEQIQADTGHELNTLNKKARGLRAYGDILPGGQAKLLRGKKG